MVTQSALFSQQSSLDQSLPGCWKLGVGRAVTLKPREDGVLRIAHDISNGYPVDSRLIATIKYLDGSIVGGIDNPPFIKRLKRIGIHRLLDLIGKALATRNNVVEHASIFVIGEINKKLPLEQRYMLKGGA